MDNTKKAEGFAGQVLHTLPPPLIEADHPLLRALYVTDIGWYPRARHHFRERPCGAGENILILCAEGSGWAEVEGRPFVLRKGEALLIPRGVPHAYGADDAAPWSIHWAHFRGDNAAYYLRLLPDGEHRLPVSATCLTECEGLFRSAYAVLAESYGRANILYLAQLCHHLLGLLFYHNAAYSPTLRAPASHDVRPTVEHLIGHCTEPLTRDGLARHAGLSVAHFSLLFQRQTGMSPIQFLIQQRMRRACQLMDTTSLNIREIAACVGYDDPYYFSRLFSKAMSCSPRQYRQTRKG